jgi:hypothetical protein
MRRGIASSLWSRISSPVLAEVRAVAGTGADGAAPGVRVEVEVWVWDDRSRRVPNVGQVDRRLTSQDLVNSGWWIGAGPVAE